ncbi:hypothetical protein [Sphingobium aromaticiconvertens]|uniref:hypothetical protein n=1 Tax=Sphingobium aromaticiconvertens TaxID=365341 RepID=UPI003015BF50
MKRWPILVVASAMLAPFAPAHARTVDYSLDKPAIEAAALDQGIEGPFSDAPALGTLPLTLENPTAADHSVKIVSVYCQAYKMDNPVAALMSQLLPPAPMSASATPTLRLIRGSTLLRCLGNGEFKNICKNEVKLTAELRFQTADGATTMRPIVASVEREGRVGGFCGNMARYTAIVSREAGIELIRKASAIYAQASAAQ